MAKRFTDTEKWKDAWYIALNNDYKIIWQWLIDNCTHAGFCKRNIPLINLMCKVNVTEEEVISAMERRVIIIGNDWFIPKFIKFQYSTLRSAKPAIIGVVKELFEKNCIGLIPESFGNNYIIKEESFENHCKMIKDKDKDKDKDKVSNGENGSQKKPTRGDPGIKFSDDGRKVFFGDGIFQELGPDQLASYRAGTLRPRDVKWELSY